MRRAATQTVTSSPELQARCVTRHAELPDSVGARGAIQLLFADLDLPSPPPPIPPNLPPFAQIGVVDSEFSPQPALAARDALHARPLSP